VTIDLGVARGVDAQSSGPPGQRTFRLRLIGSSMESASLWVEKEHLSALSLAFKQVLERVGYTGTPSQAELSGFPETPDHDFRVGGIGIGFNSSNGTLVLQVGELETEEDPTLRVQLTLDDCAALVEQMDAIIAAGRPTCLLCGLAVDPSGHACVRSNGDREDPIPDSGAEGGDS
jgi:uncharacterized repeat protein (TIGR03847 family)